MKLLLPSLLFISTIFIFSCKKDIARKMTGNYTGMAEGQTIDGILYMQSLPVQATMANAPGDSITLTIGSGSEIFFSQTLPVISKSRFGYISFDGNQSYEGTIKGDSLIFLYTNAQSPMQGRLIYKARRN